MSPPLLAGRDWSDSPVREWTPLPFLPRPRVAIDDLIVVPSPREADSEWDCRADAAIAHLDWVLLADEAVVEIDRLDAPERFRALRLAARVLGFAGAAAAGVLFLGLAVVPRTGAYSTLTVLSDSMSPAIRAGSVVIDVPVRAGDVRPGDIITYRAPLPGGPVITHRVINTGMRNGDVLLITKGDANDAVDPWKVAIPGADTELAREVMVIPHLGQGIRLLRQPGVRQLVVWLAPFLLCLQLLWRIWRS